MMRIRNALLLLAIVMACAAGSSAVISESWDSGHQNWHYWVGPSNEPLMSHVASGGVGDSGYVEVDFPEGNSYQWKNHSLGGDLDWVYFPGYVYPYDDGLTGITDFTGADLSVYVQGSADLDMQSGALYLYIAKHDEVTEDWSIFRYNTAFGIGNETWQQTSMTLGTTEGSGANEWVLMDGGDFTLAQTLTSATEFGFAITGVQDNEDNPSGILRFDELVIVPEPVTIALLGLGGLMLRRRK